MTEQERQLVAACGEFCHVTAIDIRDFIDEFGLDPRFDQSVVLRGPKRPRAVYVCPMASLDKVLAFVGDRAPDQPRLFVYRMDAQVLCDRNCGPDYGYLVYFVEGDVDHGTIEL